MASQSRRPADDLDAIIKRYQNTVYGLALFRTGSPSDADDIFQEVFLAYYRKHPNFEEEEHRKAWLIRTTINHCKKVTLSLWRKRTLPLEEAAEAPSPFQLEEESLLYSAMRELPEPYRSVLYLYYFEDRSTRQIAESLQCKEATVRMQLTRGRQRLREKVKGAYFDET